MKRKHAEVLKARWTRQSKACKAVRALRVLAGQGWYARCDLTADRCSPETCPRLNSEV